MSGAARSTKNKKMPPRTTLILGPDLSALALNIIAGSFDISMASL